MLIKVNLGQTVLKVAAFRFDASVKTSLALLDCRVNHLLVKFISYGRDALMQ